MVRMEVVVRGRVQGVAFRWYTLQQARTLDLTGWVRNRPDGSVQILAEGPRDRLETFCDWVGRGPDRARVDHLEVAWSEAGNRFEDFQIT
jgi:acylphosphatase